MSNVALETRTLGGRRQWKPLNGHVWFFDKEKAIHQSAMLEGKSKAVFTYAHPNGKCNCFD